MSCLGGGFRDRARGRGGGVGTALCSVEGRAEVRLGLRFLNIRPVEVSVSVDDGRGAEDEDMRHQSRFGSGEV